MLAVREIEQEQGSERTARTLVELAGRPKNELAALAAHALGGLGEAGKAELPKLAKALSNSAFPADTLNQLGAGDIPLWFAEVLLRPNDPSFGDASFALGVRLDLSGEERLLPLLLQAAGHQHLDEWNWQQYWAIHALRKMGDAATSARPLLVDILREEAVGNADRRHEITRHYVRGAAAYALGQIGAEPKRTARLFTGMLKHPDPRIRDWCALGLALLEQHQCPVRAARMLVHLCTAREREVVAAAAHTLGRMGEAGKSVLPELARSLHESGFPPELLNQYDPGDIPLWLAEGLLRPDDRAFRHMGPALACFDLRGETRLLPLLIQGAKHSNLDVRYWAVCALADMEETAASARPLLVNILKEEPPPQLTPGDVTKWNMIRADAANGLSAVGTQADSTVRLLAEMLRHPDEEVWRGAALALGRMRERSVPAIPALVDALTRDEAITPWKTTHAVVTALSRIAGPAIPALMKALRSKNHVVRRRAAEAFLGMYEKKTALGALVKAATEDQNREVRRMATLALVFPYGSDTDETVVVPALIRIVKDHSPEVRAAGVRALAALRPREFPSQPFVDLFGDPDANVRLAAVRAFSSLPLNKEITSALEPLLNDSDDQVRTWAKDLRERLRGM